MDTIEPDVLKSLTADELIQVAGEAELRSETASILAGHTDRRVRAALAANRNTPLDYIIQLVGDDDATVRLTAAGHPALPPEWIEKLSTGDDHAVLEGLLNNPNTGDELRKRVKSRLTGAGAARFASEDTDAASMAPADKFATPTRKKKKSAKKPAQPGKTPGAAKAKVKTSAEIGGKKEQAKEEKAAEPGSDIVPIHTDGAAVVDKLGRLAIARVLAARIRRVASDENWPEGAAAPADVAGFFKEKWREFRALFSFQKKETPFVAHADPLMIHLHGPWGSGKTSILNFMHDALSGKDKKAIKLNEEILKHDLNAARRPWQIIHANAWHYQRFGSPWWMLVSEIYRQAYESMRQEDPKRARELWLNHRWFQVFSGRGPYILLAGIALWAVTLWGSPDGLKYLATAITVLGGLWTLMQVLLFNTVQASTTLMEMSADPLKPLRRYFRDTIHRIGKPVAIFVDDLDRCEPAYVIQFLQGIQTILAEAPAAYVIAADRHWLRGAYDIEHEKLKDYVGEPGRPMGYLFLEKFFQLSVSVPKIANVHMQRFWHGLLTKQELTEAEEQTEQIEQQIDRELAGKDTTEALQQAVESTNNDDKAGPMKKHKMRERFAMHMVGEAAEKELKHKLAPYSKYLKTNPRAMKRMINTYGLHRTVDVLAGRHTGTDVLARWTILEINWPLLAEKAALYPEIIDCIRNGGKAKPEWGEEIRPLLNHEGVRYLIIGDDQTPGLTTQNTEQCLGKDSSSHAEEVMS